MAGWGNGLRPGEIARLKRHRVEVRHLRERIGELEAEVARLAPMAECAYHFSACAHWRGGDCTCLGDVLAEIG